jgi:hypothetical protein
VLFVGTAVCCLIRYNQINIGRQNFMLIKKFVAMVKKAKKKGQKTLEKVQNGITLNLICKLLPVTFIIILNPYQ